jgi:hypothetical protein
MNRIDVEIMVRAHALLVATHQSLSQSNYAGRINAMATIDVATGLIARLFNRCEPLILAAQAAAAPAELVNDQSGLTACVESKGSPDLKPTE